MSEWLKLRGRLAVIDDRILELLAERFKIADEIIGERLVGGGSLTDDVQEGIVLRRALEKCGDRGAQVYRAVIAAAKGDWLGEIG